MSKIADIKAKVQTLLFPLRKKLGWNNSEPSSNSTSRPAGIIGKTIAVYKSGSTGTRLLLWVLLLFATVTVYSSLQVLRLLRERSHELQEVLTQHTPEFNKLEAMLKEKSEVKHDIASTVSLDKIRINSVGADGAKGFISISLWVKCDSPKTAKIVESTYPKFHDAIVTQIQEIQEAEITTEVGKKRLQEEMLQAMNSVLSGGKILEVFFYNFVFDRPDK